MCPFFRMLPTVWQCVSAGLLLIACGCAGSNSPYAAGRLPYPSQTTAARDPFRSEQAVATASNNRPATAQAAPGQFAAAPSPPPFAAQPAQQYSAQPTQQYAARPANAFAADASESAWATAQSPAQPPMAAAPFAEDFRPAATVPAGAVHQTAFFEQPTSTAGDPFGDVRTQAAQSAAAAQGNPFADFAATAPATSGEWQTGTGSGAVAEGDQFLPPR